MRKFAVTAVCVAIFAFAATGCQRNARVPVPAVAPSHPEKISIPADKQATFLLSKIVATIRPGTPIIFREHPNIFSTKWICNFRLGRGGTILWRTGSTSFGDWRTGLGEIFHETLSGLGFNIAGDPKDLFGKHASASAAEYLIGARITNIRGNLCHAHDIWWRRPSYKYAGDIYVAVEWIVYSALRNQELLRLETKGYYNRRRPERGDAVIMLATAFEQAVRALAAEKKFIDLAARTGSAVLRSAERIENQPPIRFKFAKTSKKPAKLWIDQILSNVVTVRAGNSHGSGFMVSGAGHLLTNAHVVGEAKKVLVRFSNGLEITGDVVRRNSVRDTALIKVPLRTRSPLPVSFSPIKRLTDVYAIGSPIVQDLHSTVTRGVVSAFRTDKATGLTYIQADVAISPGNSGGPLIDKSGNVIGISVLKLVRRGAEGIGLFIPIADALKSLKLSPDGGV